MRWPENQVKTSSGVPPRYDVMVFWKVPWSTVLTRTLVPPFADSNAVTMSARPFLTPGSEALLPIDRFPPFAVMLPPPPPLVAPPPQAAMNAARLPYPAILRMSRRDRSRFSNCSMPLFGTTIRCEWAFRALMASRESPMGLLLHRRPQPGNRSQTSRYASKG